MRVDSSVRAKGVGSKIVSHIIQVAKTRGYRSLILETGSMAYFKPAINLYLKYDFTYCKPFGTYKLDPNSVFMKLNLNNQ